MPSQGEKIVREFPQNAVTRTSRDVQRNSCPYHCNARRVVNALHSQNVALELSTSCRKLVQAFMCYEESIDMDDPLQWNQDCAFGKCKNCPSPAIFPLSDETAKANVAYSQWDYYVDEKKKAKQKAKKPDSEPTGRVFGLVNKSESVMEVVSELFKQVPKLKQHIYTAHAQWNGHATHRHSLDNESIITIEDYQQNIEVEYIEKPTSLAYSTNKLTAALYPICVEYKVLLS